MKQLKKKKNAEIFSQHYLTGVSSLYIEVLCTEQLTDISVFRLSISCNRGREVCGRLSVLCQREDFTDANAGRRWRWS